MPRAFFLLFALLLFRGGAEAQSPSEAEIRALLDGSAVAWNEGDLAGHVAMYTDSAGFMTGRGPIYGRATTAAALERAFFRDGRPVQSLRYENVTVEMLGDDHAMVVGHFVLSGGGQDDHAGWFTTIWRRTADGWRVVHDHSS